jgi:hypothetical protein
MGEKFDFILQHQKDYQLSFLHNILNRSVSGPLQKKEIIPLNDSPAKSVPFRIFSVNSIQIIEFKKFNSMFF